MRQWTTLVGVALTAFLAACGSDRPDGPPLQGSLSSVQAVALPCRGLGPCPPGQVCGAPPPCEPQYEVGATLHLSPVAGDPAAVTSFTAELLDVSSRRVASPQAWSQPAVPFSVAPAGMDLPLSFLTAQGAQVLGGSVRVRVSGADSNGARWDLTVSAPVTR